MALWGVHVDRESLPWAISCEASVRYSEARPRHSGVVRASRGVIQGHEAKERERAVVSTGDAPKACGKLNETISEPSMEDVRSLGMILSYVVPM